MAFGVDEVEVGFEPGPPVLDLDLDADDPRRRQDPQLDRATPPWRTLFVTTSLTRSRRFSSWVSGRKPVSRSMVWRALGIDAGAIAVGGVGGADVDVHQHGLAAAAGRVRA